MFAPAAILKMAGVAFEIKEPSEVINGAGFAVPIVTFPEGYTLSQTPVICHCLGKRFNMIGNGEADEFVANQLLADNADFFAEVFAGKPAARINKWIDYIATKLGEKEFFLGGPAPSAVDLSFYGSFNMIKSKMAKGKHEVEGFVIPANLDAWITKIGALPVVAEMLASVPMLPESKV